MSEPTVADQKKRRQARGKKRQTKDNVRLVLAVIGLALLVAFVIDNSQPVNVGFLFFHTRISLIWVILISAFLGGVVDRLIIFLFRRRKARASKADLPA